MAPKKRKKKTTSKKARQKQLEQQIFWQNLVIFILATITLFKLGFIGRSLTSGIKLLVGNSYLVLLVLIMVINICRLFKINYLAILTNMKIVGASLAYIGILLACTLQFDLYEHQTVISSTWTAWKAGYSDVGGGLIGAILYQGLEFLISNIGVYIVSICSILVGFLMIFPQIMQKLPQYLSTVGEQLQNWFHLVQKSHRARKAKKQQSSEQVTDDNFTMPMEETVVAKEPTPIYNEPAEPVFEEPVPTMPDNAQDTKSEVLEPMVFVDTEDDDYQLPPLSLLNKLQPVDQTNEKRSVEYKKQVLKQTFNSFGVDATVEDYHVGPAITKFEIKLAVGVKVSKIINLADDLALALAAKDVRIEAPIPGKSLIGIEVPNQTVSMVSFREVMEAKPTVKTNLLEVPLGKDISGQVIMADLAKMPHLLIAGSTGSGKSVCINGIITSLLMQAKPHEVKLMMIDPKMVELSSYNGIPHLLTPVVTNPRKASQALHKIVEEMERRYELFAQTGVRNMAGYNDYVQKNQDANLTSLPYIVVIVDELADLMMVASREVEDAITRLAQMARAAGIHMVLATQRPSVDVITGLIKANVPSRIAFAVSSGTDSRTILDSNGAEKLLGRGDMLFIPIGENKPIRVQGAFISDAEVEKVVTFITDQKGPDYRAEMEPTEVDEIGSNPQNQTPARFEEAVELVTKEQKASASMIQRRLHIGYNAAANIIEEMENRGMIGPANGSKPREVYITPPTENDSL